MTPEVLSGVAGLLASLAASYIPGLREWFGKLEGTQKRLVMALVLLAVAAGATAAACTGTVNMGCRRDNLQDWILGIVQAFLAALVANQSAYTLTARKPEQTPPKARPRPARARSAGRPYADPQAGSGTE